MNNQSPKCPKCGGMLMLVSAFSERKYCWSCDKNFTPQELKTKQDNASTNEESLITWEKWQAVFKDTYVQ